MLETSAYLPKVETLSFGQDAQWRLPASILDYNPHPVLCFSTTGRLVYANPAATQAQLALQGVGLKQFRRTLLAAGPEPTELEIGGYWWQLVRVDAPEHELLIFYLVDITVRRQAEQQREFMQQMLDASSTLFTVYDTADEPIFYNRAVRELLQNLQVYSGPARHDPGNPAYAEFRRRHEINALARRTNGEVRQELTLTLDSGERRWYQTVRGPLHNPDGTVFVLGVTTDISDVKRSEEALTRREKQYHDLLRYTQTLICTHDLEGRLLTLNPALQALLQQPEEALVGQSISRGLHPEYRAAFADYLQQITSTGTASGVLRLSLPGQDAERYLLYHNTLVEEAGQPAYVIGHSHDITARIEAERETRRSRQQAEANARARELFLAHMSHEVRTPLNGMLGLATQLGKNGIRTAVKHLTDILEEFLSVGKIEDGQLAAHPRRTELPALLDEAVAEVQGLRKPGQRIELQLTTDDESLWLDASLLRKVLVNVLSNALKYSGEHSRVLVQASQAAGTLTISIQDQGIGISADDQEHLFKRFFRARNATNIPGTGLGLYIIGKYLELLGGHITLQSELSIGTTVTITVPYENHSVD